MRGIGLVAELPHPISNLMLTILAGVATWEHELMLERRRKAVAKAMTMGNTRGAPPATTPRRSSD